MSRQRQDYDHVIKLLVIGDSGVGKTSLLLRFSEDSFTTSFISTIGIDFKIKKVMIDEKCCKLQIWDTAGQERFRTITKAYYRGAMGIMLIYDTTDEKSFQNVRNWMKNIEQNAAPSVNKILIGNKSDSTKRAISTSMGEALAQEFDIDFFETSAKTGSFVEDAFIQISRQVKDRLEKEKPVGNSAETAPVGIVKANKKDSKQKKKCC